MKLAKMRHQRGRVRPTVRPADFAAHPANQWDWRQEVIRTSRDRAHVVCAHCHRALPCPTQVYLHGQEGHDFARCGGSALDCDVFARGQYAREHEVV